MKTSSSRRFYVTFSDFEFLIIDDASTDQTVAYLQDLREPRVRLLKSEQRLRLAGALNLGFLG